MVTMAQRLEALRAERGISRPALSAALGFPKTAMEKFETGRQTPTQEQQKKLADYFGVSLFYLRGESDDPTRMETWLNGGDVPDDDNGAPAGTRRSGSSGERRKEWSGRSPRRQAGTQQSGISSDDGAVFNALLKSPSFQALVRSAVLEVLRSPEGQDILAKAIRRQLDTFS